MTASLKGQTAWNREDRDLLIELRTEMTALRADVQDIKGNFTMRILNLESNAVNRIDLSDLEKRARNLETSVARIQTWGSAALLLLGAAEFFLNFVIK